MSIPIVAGDRISVTFACYAANQVGLNVTNWVCQSEVGSVTLQEIAEWFDSEAEAEYKALLSGVASYYGVKTQRFYPAPKTIGFVAADNIGVGTAGTALLPTQTCGIITTQTPFAGSGFRGRLYIPFPDEADNDNATSLPTAGYKARLAALAAVICVPTTVTVGINSCVLLPYVRHSGSHTGEVIDNYAARQKWATQKSRGSYGQPNTYPPF